MCELIKPTHYIYIVWTLCRCFHDFTFSVLILIKNEQNEIHFISFSMSFLRSMSRNLLLAMKIKCGDNNEQCFKIKSPNQGKIQEAEQT